MPHNPLEKVQVTQWASLRVQHHKERIVLVAEKRNIMNIRKTD